MPSSNLILCRPLFLLPPIPPSIRIFSNESTLHMRWPKYWSFSFSIIPSKDHPGLISFRMGWLDLLAGQGALKSLLQHHSSKASILRLFLNISVCPCIQYADTLDLEGFFLALLRVLPSVFQCNQCIFITIHPYSFILRKEWGSEAVHILRRHLQPNYSLIRESPCREMNI